MNEVEFKQRLFLAAVASGAISYESSATDSAKVFADLFHKWQISREEQSPAVLSELEAARI